MKTLKNIAMGLGVLASFAAVSCSDYDAVDESAIRHELALQEYNKNFITRYGQPDPNHTWGFTDAVTRAVDPNGNLWGEYDKIPVPVTQNERNLVYAYVRKLDDSYEFTKENWSDYFATCVWTGNVNSYTGDDAEALNEPTTPKTTNVDGSLTVDGAAKMNHLLVLENAGQTQATAQHIYDFNKGNNDDWDQHMLMYDSGTLNFWYHSSEGDYYSDNYIVVPGSEIHPSLAGFYYVCFDFESYAAYAATNLKITYDYTKDNGNGATETVTNQELNYSNVPGYFPMNEQIPASDVTWKAWVWDGSQSLEKTFDSVEEWIKACSYNSQIIEVSNVRIQATGYQNANQMYAPDGNHTDWIIRLIPTQKKSLTTTKTTKRIMCEDLGNTSDFDFNDVVFDATWDSKTPNEVTITLQAAGGTLPIYIDGKEVHKTLRNDPNAPTTMPVNVNANDIYGGIDKIDPVSFDVTLGADAASWADAVQQVKILVGEGEAVHVLKLYKNSEDIIPKAFAVPTTVKWTKESQQIEDAYGEFKNWVNDDNGNANWYQTVTKSSLLY